MYIPTLLVTEWKCSRCGSRSSFFFFGSAPLPDHPLFAQGRVFRILPRMQSIDWIHPPLLRSFLLQPSESNENVRPTIESLVWSLCQVVSVLHRLPLFATYMFSHWSQSPCLNQPTSPHYLRPLISHIFRPLIDFHPSSQTQPMRKKLSRPSCFSPRCPENRQWRGEVMDRSRLPLFRLIRISCTGHG